MIKNLTEGKPLKLLFFFSLPMLMGNLFQQLYNMVDSMVVGNFVGADALASVGASFPVVFLAVALASGLSMGCNVVISQLFGAGRIREMKTTISTALISQFALSIVITIVGELIAPLVLRLLKTPENILGDSLIYLQIYFGGLVFLFIYNTLNGIFNALGDSKAPLYFLMLSTLTNIVLDLTFVIKFHMGVAGVAWATLIAQGICAVLSLITLMHRIKHLADEPGHEQEGKRPIFHFTAVERIAKIGVPSMIQQSIVSVSMLLMQSLVNSFGPSYIAGYTAATKIDSLAMLPNMNFSNAMSSYTAQNIGAGKESRVKEGYKANIFMVVVFSLALTLCIFLFGSTLMNLFMDSASNVEVLNYGIAYMRVVSSFYILMGIMFTSNGLLRGAGDMKFFMASSLFNLLCRIAVAYVLAPHIGSIAIAWSIPIGWLVGGAISFLRFRSGKWKNSAIVKQSEKQ